MKKSNFISLTRSEGSLRFPGRRVTPPKKRNYGVIDNRGALFAPRSFLRHNIRKKSNLMVVDETPENSCDESDEIDDSSVRENTPSSARRSSDECESPEPVANKKSVTNWDRSSGVVGTSGCELVPIVNSSMCCVDCNDTMRINCRKHFYEAVADACKKSFKNRVSVDGDSEQDTVSNVESLLSITGNDSGNEKEQSITRDFRRNPQKPASSTAFGTVHFEREFTCVRRMATSSRMAFKPGKTSTPVENTATIAARAREYDGQEESIHTGNSDKDVRTTSTQTDSPGLCRKCYKNRTSEAQLFDSPLVDDASYDSDGEGSSVAEEVEENYTFGIEPIKRTYTGRKKTEK